MPQSARAALSGANSSYTTIMHGDPFCAGPSWLSGWRGRDRAATSLGTTGCCLPSLHGCQPEEPSPSDCVALAASRAGFLLEALATLRARDLRTAQHRSLRDT
jgi:hypothetical protein